MKEQIRIIIEHYRIALLFNNKAIALEQMKEEINGELQN